MEAASKQAGLKSGFAIQGHNSPFSQGATPGPKLFKNTHTIVRDVTNARQPGNQEHSHNAHCNSEHHVEEHRCSPPAAVKANGPAAKLRALAQGLEQLRGGRLEWKLPEWQRRQRP